MQVRANQDRGHARLGWLDSRHTFSFGHYYDPQHMGFSDLRVINEDRVEPGAGFGTHGHRDMEIISYVLEGSLEHRDSLGNVHVIEPGDVQRMTAGSGIRHSEYNGSAVAPVHFLQIWIEPDRAGLPPGYEQRHFDGAALDGGLRLVVSPDGADGSVTIHQDMRLYAGRFPAARTFEHAVPEDRQVWLQIAQGAATVDGHRLNAGDGAAIRGAGQIRIDAAAGAELLLFELRKVA